jgi:hypothetical protein
MKKILFLGAMAAMLLGTASCSSDMEPAMGGETPVSFSINLGDDIDSRTISDGTGANQLKFAVFENGTEIHELAQTVAVADKKATVTTRLVKGHTYSFVFWAQNSACTAYNTTDMSAIKVDYTSVNCNDESRDAFYKMDSFKVTEAFETTEVLTRPFAQINFLASDAAGVLGVDAYKSKVTVTGVPTTLNTLDGTVGTETADVTFALATIPKETLAGYKDYKYVAMNYILAATDKEMKDEVVLTVNDGTQDVNTVTVANCPVQRNYRTNIFGDLFTLQGKFNVVIDPIYQGDHEVELVEATPVSTEDELAKALAATGKSTISVKLMNDVDLHYGARVGYGDASTKDIIIDGNGHNLNLHGTDTDCSSFGAIGDANLTIKNATITKEEPGNGAWNNHAINLANRVVTGEDQLGTGKIYLKNCDISNSVTIANDAVIEDCNFTEAGGYYTLIIEAMVNNTVIKNCTFTATNDGRGIKVMDQYNTDVAVQCNINISDCSFETAKKAAILVTNIAGAKITASNLDITKVAADNEYAVWNDADRKAAWDLVEVTGCTKKQE